MPGNLARTRLTKQAIERIERMNEWIKNLMRDLSGDYFGIGKEKRHAPPGLERKSLLQTSQFRIEILIEGTQVLIVLETAKLIILSKNSSSILRDAIKIEIKVCMLVYF